jgi:long-chain acyl-CoA synthetase
LYPAEIERAVHASGHLAAVGRLADEVKGELAKAYVILKSGAEVSRAALAAHCRDHLDAYKVPRGIRFVSTVPATASGKNMRRLSKDVDDGSLSIN